MERRPLNILTHPVHTGYQFDLAQTGHQFYSLDIPGTGEVFWDERSRPKPPNFHLLKRLSNANVTFDLALVHYNTGYHVLKPLDLPMIYKEHCVRGPFTVPPEMRRRITHYSFASRTAADRWRLPAKTSGRKTIIGMGVDLETYKDYEGFVGRILVVGQKISSRGNEKGRDNLLIIGQTLPMTIVGHGNDPLPGAVGAAENYNQLLGFYRSHRCFLNPSHLLGMSTLEAMATGMPVVTFRMLNSDVIVDGHNGFVVNNTSDAAKALERLLSDEALAREIGNRARETIRARFSKTRFVERWNDLFDRAMKEYQPGTSKKIWPSFDLASKSERQRKIAEKIISTAFEYDRVGYDSRKMTFDPDGRVGEGMGGREVFWDVKTVKGRWTLELSSGASVTCRLKRARDGSWRGRWLVCEKMPIALKPLSAPARRSRQELEIVALIAIRNEGHYLKGYFQHLRDYVDGFIVFDDNSTDNSAELVRAEPKVLAVLERKEPSSAHFFEVANRKALLSKAWECGAKWVLCCDADERHEIRFLQELRALLRSNPERSVMALRLRALWNDTNQYRMDGIYADRRKYILFPCMPPGDYYPRGILHSPWYPPVLASPERKQILPFNLYHLKSITASDRAARYEKFKVVDPLLTQQPEGYEHLISERGAIFEKIPAGREYQL